MVKIRTRIEVLPKGNFLETRLAATTTTTTMRREEEKD